MAEMVWFGWWWIQTTPTGSSPCSQSREGGEMFRFQCEWGNGPTTSARSGYELGHMSFAGEEGICTSRGKVPDQSMMVCIAIVELLDGLTRFLVEGQVEYTFVGIDSSFSVTFRRTKKGRIAVR